MENYFKTLNDINVNDKVEKKNGFSYLSWAWAWQIAKLHDQNVRQTVYETPEGRNYWHDGKTAWVKVGVTMFDREHIEYYPIIDYKNQAIPVDKITSMNVNTSLQRGSTKALGRHGLGLYLYAGEDLPEEDKTKKAKKEEAITPYNGEKPEGVTSAYLTSKFVEIENEIKNSASLDDLKKAWAEYQPDIKTLKDFEPQTYTQLIRGKATVKQLYGGVLTEEEKEALK
jgi:hypothetical protein